MRDVLHRPFGLRESYTLALRMREISLSLWYKSTLRLCILTLSSMFRSTQIWILWRICFCTIKSCSWSTKRGKFDQKLWCFVLGLVFFMFSSPWEKSIQCLSFPGFGIWNEVTVCLSLRPFYSSLTCSAFLFNGKIFLLEEESVFLNVTDLTPCDILCFLSSDWCL